MPHALRLVAVTLALFSAPLGCHRLESLLRAGSWPAGGSVLLVTIDTLRADHVGAYGAQAARTPALDSLARHGTRFSTAIAATPLTLPSHGSILTGRYPPRHGVRHNGIFHLAEEAETLAERLHDAGYATGAVVGAYVLAHRFGLAQGFDHYDDAMSSKRSEDGDSPERSASDVTDRALEWLAGVERPFFLWVHYYDPHAEYAPPLPYSADFRERPYDGEIAYVDAELERLMNGLREAGRLEDTLVVATADHGESLGEHQEATHRYTLYDATLAVPLLFQGPGIPVGRVVRGVVRTVDIAPTVLARLDLPPLPDADGRDLAPLWRDGARPSERVAYAETLATRFDHGWSPLHALRSAQHHYVRAPRAELYAAQGDPQQLRNLLTPGGEGEHELIAKLEAQLSALLGEAAEPSPDALDPEARERLAALGYVLPTGSIRETGMDPKDGLLWLGHYAHAEQAVAGHELERARRLLEELLQAMPESASAHALLGEVLLLQGRPDLALPHGDVAARLLPEDPARLVFLGNARAQLGDVAAAVEAYRRAAELNASHPGVQLGLMWMEAQRGRLGDAKLHAQSAAELDPYRAETHTRTGAIWEQVGAYERALQAYRHALELDPDSERLHMILAIQMARLGRDSASQAHLQRAGRFGEAPYLRNRLGIVYAARGDAARAEKIFRDLLRRHPDYATARRNLETLLRSRNPGDSGSRKQGALQAPHPRAGLTGLASLP
jgi:arylsulfatase A-like enzyme/Flp pilus assembly protein TadD